MKNEMKSVGCIAVVASVVVGVKNNDPRLVGLGLAIALTLSAWWVHGLIEQLHELTANNARLEEQLARALANRNAAPEAVESSPIEAKARDDA